MREVEREINRYLTLLRNKIRERGFTQLEVQQALGWGRSYISQLLTKQKSLRVEQVLLILQVIGADTAEFFAELYSRPGLPGARRIPEARRMPEAPPSAPDETKNMRLLLQGLIEVLVAKRLVTGNEVKEAAEAAELEGAESPA